MATYTPTPPNTTPTFGQSGEGVRLLQQSLNATNKGKAGWVPLKEDGLYGPKTQAGAGWKPQSNLVVTGTPARKEGMMYSSQLTNMLSQLGGATGLQQGDDKNKEINVDTYSDSFTQALDRHAKTSDDASKALISTIQASAQNQKAELAGSYDTYKRGLQLLGIQHNEAQFTPDLLQGKVLQAQNEYSKKISTLNAEQAKALMDAKAAKEDNDFAVLKEKMEYVKQIKKDKDNALKDLYDKMNTEQKIGDIQAHTIYDELQKLGDSEKEVYLQQVAQKYGIPLQTLVQSISDEHTARIKAAKGSGSGGGYTSQELRKLRQAGIDPTDIESADNFLYGDEGGSDFYSLADQYVADNTDDNGYITADGFKELLKQGLKDKQKRDDIIDYFKDKLYLRTWRKAQNYGLTKKEFDALK